MALKGVDSRPLDFVDFVAARQDAILPAFTCQAAMFARLPKRPQGDVVGHLTGSLSTLKILPLAVFFMASRMSNSKNMNNSLYV
jgi:hypothetical protein